MKIAISAETTVDLTKELLAEYNIEIIPYSIQLGNRFADDGDITSEEIISYVNQTGVLPKTSAINEFQYNEHFEKLLKNYDAVVHFCLSSGASCACSNAKSAAEKLENVYVIDSKSLSTGIALLAIYARELANEGALAKEIYEKCQARVPFVQASFVLKRLDYLHKGGRCSSLTLLGANVLKIRPQIVLRDGKMVSGKKYRGNYNHIVKSYCDDVLNEFSNPDLKHGFVTYTTADDEVVQTAINFLKDRGFENIHVTRAGATITSHCGEDCLGILYLNDGGVSVQ